MVEARATVIVGALGFALIAPGRQSAAPKAGPRFDVVSIQIDNHGGTGSSWDSRCTSGRWSGRNVDVRTLVTTAYGILDVQIQGLPDWNDKPLHRYHLTATCPGNAAASATGAMLQALLADRFGLVAHFETHTLRVRTLEQAKGGAKLKTASGDCLPALAGPVPPPGGHFCDVFYPTRTGPGPGNHPQDGQPMTTRFQAWSASIADFVQYFGRSGRLDQPPLFDETGLKGKYDWDFHYEVVLNLKDQDGHPVDQSYQAYEAMNQQLGLIWNQDKLTPQSVPILVIDHITPATPN